MTTSDYFLAFLQNLNRTIVQEGELGDFEYTMQGTGMRGDFIVLKNYKTREVYYVRSKDVKSDHMDNPLGISTSCQQTAIRMPNCSEEQYFQASTVLDIITQECEQELQLAMHNLATYTRDMLCLYNDDLWHKPYSDM